MSEIKIWSGIITGVVTPFGDDGTIDWESYERHLDRLVGKGLIGLLVNAMMSEGGHISLAERESTLRFAVNRVGSKLPLISTIYGCNTEEAAAEAARAEKIGASALLVFPHAAFGGAPLDPRMPASFFAAIARASALPMIVFRTPETLGPTFGLEVTKRLCDVRGVAAIKDSAANAEFYRGPGAFFLTPGSPLKVLIDSDLAILDFLRMGAHGATSICASLNPGAYAQMFEVRHADRAARLQASLLPLANRVYQAPFRDFRARLKTVLVADGIFSTAHVRGPLMPLTGEERTAVLETSARVRASLGQLLASTSR